MYNAAPHSTDWQQETMFQQGRLSPLSPEPQPGLCRETRHRKMPSTPTYLGFLTTVLSSARAPPLANARRRFTT